MVNVGQAGIVGDLLLTGLGNKVTGLPLTETMGRRWLKGKSRSLIGGCGVSHTWQVFKWGVRGSEGRVNCQA